ncbi:MAG: hypothetical protein SNJ78_02235 [Spirochaetales bacterium]
MKLYYHLVFPHLSNTYLLISEKTNEGILIDPGSLDLDLVHTIEKNQYALVGVLVTGNTPAHTDGIPTLLRVYPSVQIFSAENSVKSCPCITLRDGDTIDLAGLKIQTLGMPAYSREAVFYKIQHIVFTGDVLTAGKLGRVLNTFSRALLKQRLLEYLSEWDPDTLLFPGFGPPTRSGLELQYNIDLKEENLKATNYRIENEGLV